MANIVSYLKTMRSGSPTKRYVFIGKELRDYETLTDQEKEEYHQRLNLKIVDASGAYYSENLGCWVTDRAHKKRLLKARGAIEVG